MSEQRQNERRVLQKSAMDILSNPETLIEGKRVNLLLRLWQYPSKESFKVWAVHIEIDKEEKFLIQRVIWDKQSDGKRLSNPLVGLREGFHTSPNISTKARNVEADIIKSYIEELIKARISPFVTEEGLGLDGVTFGFEFRKFMASASFSWRNEAPEEWKGLEQWYLKTKIFLDTRIDRIL